MPGSEMHGLEAQSLSWKDSRCNSSNAPFWDDSSAVERLDGDWITANFYLAVAGSTPALANPFSNQSLV